MPSNRRDPPKPFTRTGTIHIERALTAMQMKQINLAKQPFSLPELMHLFVLPEHHVHLRYAYDLTEPSGLTSTLYVKADMPDHIRQHAGGPCYMRFTWYGKKPGGFHVPEEAGSEEKHAVRPLYGIAPEALVQKYEQVEQDLLDIQCRFTLAERVFHRLNGHCSTMAQVRYVWPAILILLKQAGMHADAETLANPSARAGAVVVLPAELTGWLKETNDTIVRAMMLDDVDDPHDTKQDVSYYLSDTFPEW